MKLSLVDYLVCISCRSSLHLKPDFVIDSLSKEEVETGTLKCAACSQEYPVERGVPRMVVERLSSSTDVQTGRNFAHAWKAFPRMDERYRKQFFDWIYPVEPSFLKDKLVLECGCGKGRHAQIVADSGAKAVFAVDIGEAIDIAYRNVGSLPNVHTIQADIANLPFAPIFDFAFSVGVLHHMAFPVRGFVAITQMLKPDGSICIWVYGRENNWWLIRLVNPIRLKITSRLHPNVLLLLSSLLALPLYLWTKLVVGPWAALTDKFPAVPRLYYQDYLAYIGHFDFVEIYHIVFDHLVTPVANYISRDYLRKWFDEANLPEPSIRWHNKNSWSAFSSFNPEILRSMKARLKPDS